MLAAPKRPEIDHRTIKLIVGVVAISLAPLTSVLARPTSLTSISASYYAGGWSQTIFLGFLFAIAALLLSYNGRSRTEMILSKVASAAALGVALFPCECEGKVELIPHAHELFAVTMFLILTFFCYGFFRTARAKGHGEANARAAIYAACGAAIVLSILVLGVDSATSHSLRDHIPRLTFYGEAVGLIAFGISWLTASRILPVITSDGERFSPFREHNPA